MSMQANTNIPLDIATLILQSEVFLRWLPLWSSLILKILFFHYWYKKRGKQTCFWQHCYEWIIYFKEQLFSSRISFHVSLWVSLFFAIYAIDLGNHAQMFYLILFTLANLYRFQTFRPEDRYIWCWKYTKFSDISYVKRYFILIPSTSSSQA